MDKVTSLKIWLPLFNWNHVQCFDYLRWVIMIKHMLIYFSFVKYIQYIYCMLLLLISAVTLYKCWDVYLLKCFDQWLFLILGPIKWLKLLKCFYYDAVPFMWPCNAYMYHLVYRYRKIPTFPPVLWLIIIENWLYWYEYYIFY